MRSPILLLFLIGWSLADDQSVCQASCSENFETEDTKSACLSGCSARSPPSSGIPLFYSCHGHCSTKFAPASTADANPVADACHHACSLPYTSSVIMTLDTTGDHPQWKVIEKSGDDVIMQSLMDGSSEENDVIRKNPLSDLLALRAPSSMDGNRDMDDMMSIHSEMEQRMRQMMETFSRRFFEDIRRGMEGEKEEEVVRHRPTGHSIMAAEGPSVGNTAADGSDIIESHPVEEGEKGRGIVIEFHRRGPAHRWSSSLQWLLLLLGSIALLASLCAILLFLRNIRTNSYRSMPRDHFLPVFGRIPAEKAVPNEKKVPLDGWLESSQPSGVPPPAYDQVSIHSLKKNTDSEASTSGSDSPSPIH